jgi:hypothetical protein
MAPSLTSASKVIVRPIQDLTVQQLQNQELRAVGFLEALDRAARQSASARTTSFGT